MMMEAAELNVPASLPHLAVARLAGHDGAIPLVRYTADGKYCLTGGQDRSVKLWKPSRLDPAFPPHLTHSTISNTSALGDNLPRALCLATYTMPHSVSALAVDDDSQLVVGSNRTLIVSDLVTQQVIRRLSGHEERVQAVALLASEIYCSGSYDTTVRLWDAKSNHSGGCIQVLREAKDSITGIFVCKNTAMIRTCSVDGNVRSYDVRKGILQCDDAGSSITGMAPTIDGQCLAISCLDGCIRLMQLDTGELLNTYSSSHVAGQYGLECCLTSNDATIVSGSEDGKAVFYDLVSAKCVQRLQGHTRPVCSVATDPRREYSSSVVTAGYDGNAIVWSHDPDYIGWQDA